MAERLDESSIRHEARGTPASEPRERAAHCRVQVEQRRVPVLGADANAVGRIEAEDARPHVRRPRQELRDELWRQRADIPLTDDDRVLMRQGNINTVRHAETELARRGADAYPPEFLWTCTLVSPGEPCAMCTGTLYWANIGRLVFGFEEAKLLAITGNHPENPTLNLRSHVVLGSGQKKIEVLGPFPEIEDELLAPHRDFWKR